MKFFRGSFAAKTHFRLRNTLFDRPFRPKSESLDKPTSLWQWSLYCSWTDDETQLQKEMTLVVAKPRSTSGIKKKL